MGILYWNVCKNKKRQVWNFRPRGSGIRKRRKLPLKYGVKLSYAWFTWFNRVAYKKKCVFSHRWSSDLMCCRQHYCFPKDSDIWLPHLHSRRFLVKYQALNYTSSTTPTTTTIFSPCLLFQENKFQLKILMAENKNDLPYRKIFGGQNCRKSDLLPKILSAEKFVRRKVCPPKFCPIRYMDFNNLGQKEVTSRRLEWKTSNNSCIRLD